MEAEDVEAVSRQYDGYGTHPRPHQHHSPSKKKRYSKKGTKKSVRRSRPHRPGQRYRRGKSRRNKSKSKHGRKPGTKNVYEYPTCRKEYWSCGESSQSCCDGLTCHAFGENADSGYCVTKEQQPNNVDQCVAPGGECDSLWGYHYGNSAGHRSCCPGSTCESKGRRHRGYICKEESPIPQPSPAYRS
jgi:hypothetical protein